jgi:Ca2+/Na+ antiporter
MTIPGDLAYMTARGSALVFMIVVIVLMVRLPRTKAVFPHREIIMLSGFVAMAAGFLFSEVGWDAKPWAYGWLALLLVTLGLIVVRSYQAARAAGKAEPDKVAS